MRMELILVTIALFSVYVPSHGFILETNGGGGFMFNSPFSHHCGNIHSTCPLQCPEYEKDGEGCDVCHCKGDSSTAILTGPDHGTDYHTIHNPCIPSQRNCPIKCEAFVRGPAGGCEFCMCEHVQHPETTQAPSPTTTQAPSTVMPTTAPATTAGTTVSQDCLIAKQICNAKCNGQYLVDPSDCTFCICKSDIPSGR